MTNLHGISADMCLRNGRVCVIFEGGWKAKRIVIVQ